MKLMPTVLYLPLGYSAIFLRSRVT